MTSWAKEWNDRVGQDSRSMLNDLGFWGSHPSVEDQVIESESLNELRCAMDQLTRKQQLVIQLRYGFWDGNKRTLDECAERMGITHQAVQRIESRALESLKRSLQASGLKK